MLKTLAKEIRQYKKATVLTPVFTGVEVLMEILIPFVTASIIDQGIEAGNMQKVYLYGGIRLIFAFISLICGVAAGRYAASASTGYACNVCPGSAVFLFKH